MHLQVVERKDDGRYILYRKTASEKFFAAQPQRPI